MMFWVLFLLFSISSALHRKTLDEIKADLTQIFDENGGDVAPFVYLSFHDSGTYDHEDDSGGPYACQRLLGCGEAEDPENNGLEIPIALLEPVKQKYHDDISYADLWAYAAVVAVKYAGGPEIDFNYGRMDCVRCQDGKPNRLPDPDFSKNASVQADHLLDIFERYGYEDPLEALVVLSGAHTLGNASPENSGYDGNWTANSHEWSNKYFRRLYLDHKDYIEEETPYGFRQFRNPDNGLIMLPSDMALLEGEDLEERVEEYHDDNKEWRLHFKHYFQKMQEFHWEGTLKAITKVIVHEDFAGWDTYKKRWNDKGMEASSVDGMGAAGTNESMIVMGSGSMLSDSQGLFYTLTDATKISSFECWLYQSDAEAQYDSGVHILDNSDRVLLDVEIAGSQLRLPNDFVDVRLGSIPPMMWVKLEVLFDWKAETMTTHVVQGDGSTETKEDIPFREKGASKVKKIRFFHYTDGTTAHYDELVITGSQRNAAENEYPGTIFAGKSLIWWAILLICIGGVLFCICLCCIIKYCRKDDAPGQESTKV